MSQKKWDGFMTEVFLIVHQSITFMLFTYRKMALFSHPAYLEPLQGIIIPRIIGVYLVDGGVSVAMELPSASFWVEASEDMSDELKLKCIKAFDALHDHSVLHGDVELHNILIGAEGNVTLVGFRKCRSTMPIEAVGLGRATDEDILLEKRLVKFKLNYGDAREREIRLMNRVVKRSESSKKRGPGHQGSWASRPTSRILSTRTRRSDKQVNEAPIEDTGHPVNAEAFASKWIEPEDFVPSCFIVPCLDEESVTKSVHQFMKMESERQESTPCIAEESRILSKSSVVASEYSSIGERPAASEFHLLSVEEHITDKKRRREGSDDDLISNSSPLKKGCHESTEEQPSDDIHVPYEGYAGPDGYTLPRCSIHDDDLAFLRRRWIQEDNARQCKEKHLDYPFELLQPGGVVTVGVAADGAKRKRMKNRGALRRLKYDAEHPNKRIFDALERLQVHRWQMHSNQFALNTTDAKQKAEGCDVGEAEGPRICSWFEFFIEENRRKVKTAAKKRTGPVGIMKSVSKRKAPRRGVLRRQLNAKECARLQGHDLKQPRAQDDADDWEDRQVSIRRYRELHASARAKNRTLSKFKASTSASGHSVGSCVGSIAKYAPSKQSINNLPELKSPTSSMPVDFRAHDAELAENKLESHQEESETERQAILPPEPLLQRGFMSLEEVMERLSEE